MNAAHDTGRFALKYLLPVALLLALTATGARAQDAPVRGTPVKPGLSLTTQDNPRGADVVEPVKVYRVVPNAAGGADSTFIGIAKIADPRRGEEGAFTNTDVASGTLIRLGGAWVFSEDGRRQIVSFQPDVPTHLVFHNGSHDVVESMQGAEPLIQEPGRQSVFDLRTLYRTARPADPTVLASTTEDRPRIAHLRMRSTYPGGEAVELSVILAPLAPPPARVMQPITVVQRDTVVIAPRYEVIIHEIQPVERSIAALISVETGYGGTLTHAAVPATLIPQFESDGRAGDMYVDAFLQLWQGQNRWTIRAAGISAVTATDLTVVDHHQLSLTGVARFESGDRRFIVAQLTGEMWDKQYQEFDWDSADYAGSMFIGYGGRRLAPNGVEVRRLQALLGLRVGENRPIEIMETRGRARGIGPTLSLGGQIGTVRPSGIELRLGTDLAGYRIMGRGHRDSGFDELGLIAHADAEIGFEMRGAYIFGALNFVMHALRADYPSGDRYSERRTTLAPGIGMQMRL